MQSKTALHHAANQRRAEASARLVVRGMALNLGLACVKFAGGILGGTYALIADGFESLLDVFSSALVWAGFRVAARPPSPSLSASPFHYSSVVHGIILFD